MKNTFRFFKFLVFLVLCLGLGFGCSHNTLTEHEKRVQLYKDGCDRNEDVYCYSLASGKALEGKHQEAKEYYQKACKLGDEHSCLKITFYDYKEGKNKDLKSIFSKDCDLGRKEDCNKLGLLESFLGNPKDAIAAHEKGCELGNVIDCGLLGIIFYTKTELEEKYLDKACKLGGEFECNLFVIKKMEKMPKEERASFARAACEKGESGYCSYLKTSMSDEETKKFSCEVCKKGNAQECLICGTEHHKVGNELEELNYYSLACVNGDSSGCELFKLMSDNKETGLRLREICEPRCSKGEQKCCEYLKKFK